MYFRYSDYLKKKYGCSVYKLPINLPLTCPNRIKNGLGCLFCGEAGAGFEALPNTTSIQRQLEVNSMKMIEMYKAEKFIAYFQNFTNTYMPPEQFSGYIKEAATFSKREIVEIAVSTRPDCIAKPYLEILDNIFKQDGINISIELGLQTANYHSLDKVNRGHTLAEFIDAVMQIKPYGFDICVHLILNLPWDNDFDAIETAKIVSALGVNQIKLHALYILKDTPLAAQYLNGEIKIITKEEYIERVIVFLEYLSPEIAVQRIIGRSPLNGSVFSNWNTSWWKIHDAIQDKMKKENRRQGRLCNYLNGAAVKNFIKT